MPEQKYAIRCWVNDGMFPFAGGLVVSEKHIEFNQNYPYRSSSDPTSKMMEKGMYTPLCVPDKYDAAIYQMEDIEKIGLSEWSSGPKIKMVLNNKARQKKITVELVIDEREDTQDSDKVREVFTLLSNKQNQ